MYLSPFNIPTVSKFYFISSFQFTAQSCPTLCSPMHCSMTVIPVGHQLLELAQTHVQQSMMPSNHLILCCLLLLLPSIFPSIRDFFNESVFHIRWPKYWSCSFSISPSSEYSGLISFRIDQLDLLAAQETLKRLLQSTVQKHQFFSAQPFLWSNSHSHT